MPHGSVGTAPLLSVVSSEKDSQEKHYIYCTIDINGKCNYNENIQRKRGVLHMNEVSNKFLNKVSLLIEEAKKNVKTAVNIAMV